MSKSKLMVLTLGFGLVGCSGTSYEYGGYKTHQYFALDGYRSWEYASDDSEVGYKLQVDKNPQVIETETDDIVTLEYSIQEPFELLFSIKWSADSGDGIEIHGMDDGSGMVDFDEKLVFAEYQMKPGESVESSSNGITIVSTFEDVSSCPNHWISEDQTWDCLHFSVDDGDGDDMSGVPFAGEWWIAQDWGASRFTPTGYTEPWVLTDGDWDPSE